MNPQDITKINGLFKQIDDLTNSLNSKDRKIQQLEQTIRAMTDRLMTEQDLREVVDRLCTKTRATKKR
jgi:prefoldin subunit 5